MCTTPRTTIFTVILSALALLFAVPTLPAAAETAEAPTAVSPGGQTGAVIQSRCPTFSWSATDGARGYEIALYRVESRTEDGTTSGTTDDAQATANAATELVTRIRLPTGATAWTPSMRQCLEWGERYAWSVRALGDARPSGAGEELWSEARLFRVSGTPSTAEVESALETMKRYLRTRKDDDVNRPGQQKVSRKDTPRENPELALEKRNQTRRAKDRKSLSGMPLKSQTISAPAIAAPSLTVDSSIVLGSSSRLLKGGTTFLKGDSSGLGAGRYALSSTSTLDDATKNTAVGYRALENTTGGSVVKLGSSNTAVGHRALISNTTGYRNTAIGVSALAQIYTTNYIVPDGNIAIGYNAGADLGLSGYSATTDLSYNIFIGNRGNSDEEGTIRIGNSVDHDRTFIAGIHGTAVTGQDVHVTSDGQLGYSSSSRRFKEEVENLGDVGEELLELEPVTFRYRPELVAGGGDPEVGLIAEEVAEVFPELVTRNAEGEPSTVRYELLSVLLLEELQRQHRLSAEDRRELTDLRGEMATLRKRLTALEDGEPRPDEQRKPWWRRIFNRDRGSP